MKKAKTGKDLNQFYDALRCVRGIFQVSELRYYLLRPRMSPNKIPEHVHALGERFKRSYAAYEDTQKYASVLEELGKLELLAILARTKNRQEN